MKKALYYLVSFLAISVAGYAIYGYLILRPGSTVTPAMSLVYQNHKATIILHALFASIALVTGIPQMSSKFRSKFPYWNIKLRSLYFISVGIGGVTGLLLAFTAQGGFSNLIGFGLLAILWIFSAIMSIYYLRVNNFTLFKKWIVRNYCFTLAAVTLRIFLGTFFWYFGYQQFEYFYPVLGFLCWVPNLIICEWIILPKPKLA